MSYKVPFNLQLFAEEGTVSAGASSESVLAGKSNEEKVTENSSTGGQAANGVNRGDDQADRRKLYSDFKKQNKDLFDEDVRGIIKSRLPNYSKMKHEKEAQDELIEMLSARYGVKGVGALKEALEKDDSYWEDAAYKADMTVDAFKEKLKRDISAAKDGKELDILRREKQAREQYETWQREADDVRAKYPEFDLNKCLENDKFRSLLTTQYREYMPSMIQIYEMLFHDDIVSSVKADTTKRVTDNIRARGQRPDEAGMNNSGGIDYAKSVASTTKEQRRELARRARNGENITFS